MILGKLNKISQGDYNKYFLLVIYDISDQFYLLLYMIKFEQRFIRIIQNIHQYFFPYVSLI